MALRAEEQRSTLQGGHTERLPYTGLWEASGKLANCGAPWCPLEVVLVK